MKNKKINILFIGDIFGQPGIDTVKNYLPYLKKKHKIDIVIAQAENVSGRKGFEEKDYIELKNAGVDVFTLGNHVWAKNDILNIIHNNDVVRPANVNHSYPGEGTRLIKINENITLRVTALMGITFNKLMKPWEQESANNFFDTMDTIINFAEKADFHFVDFHAETTSEKYVLGLYLDGKVDAICGTHTHVQTNDAHVLPKGSCYITDVGMTGPKDCAIGANFDEVYRHMRYNEKIPFVPSNNPCQFNAVVIQLSTNRKNKIFPINADL
ncbi:YmdB family metallophosphoesterase [Mycoplasma sp. U97]|uniref:TIGR00282 family metallophosphoesterase n=1 Tax=Mycoplasma tauri TaxID=547987 RepID=UPI001CBD3688|nr:TIGR00282 family metallophosphoesterase [Mycoplasma tauri]MBZ4212612.1 YmdB family metallophosphoesterase [Mycoplasma tauri]